MSSLVNLAGRINESYRLALKHADTAVGHARECGQALLEAKQSISHGEWNNWLRSNCDVGDRQAQRYMRLARNWTELPSKATRVSDLSIRGALELLTDHKDSVDDDGGYAALIAAWKSAPIHVQALIMEDVILPDVRRAFGSGAVDEEHVRSIERYAERLAAGLAPATVNTWRRARRRYSKAVTS